MDTIALLVAALATARLTRLVTRDQITHPIRRRLLARLDHDGMTAYLIVCDWCVSMWVAAAGAALGAWSGASSWWQAPGIALAFSYTAGWLASKEGE
jgi:hypothetical protein